MMTWLSMLPKSVKMGAGVVALVLATAAAAIGWFNHTMETAKRDAAATERAKITRLSDSALLVMFTPAVQLLRYERDSLSRQVKQLLAPRVVKKSTAVRRSIATLTDSSKQRPDVAELAANADSLADAADSLALAAVRVVTVTDTLQVIDSIAVRAATLLWSMERDTTAHLRLELAKRPTWWTVGKVAVVTALAVESGRRLVEHFSSRNR